MIPTKTRECISEWFKKDSSCPVCRRTLNRNKGLIEIFMDTTDKKREEADKEIGTPKGEGDAEETDVHNIFSALQKRWRSVMTERSLLKAKMADFEEKMRRKNEQIERLRRELAKATGAGKKKGDGAAGGGGAGGEGKAGEGKDAGGAGGGGGGGYDDDEEYHTACPLDIENLLLGEWSLANVIQQHDEPVHSIAVHPDPQKRLLATASWARRTFAEHS